MSTAHRIVPTGPSPDQTTARLGSAATSDNYTDKEVGKAVKLGTDSAYVLCVAGDPIQGIITAVDLATSAGWSVGSVQTHAKGANQRVFATADGLQATPGTGTIAVGDYVVTGTVVAKGTALGDAFFKVTKATVQPGAVPADLTAAGAQVLAALHAWRVVSLGPVGTGAVGTMIVIEPV
jgi:hypothetical protein